MVRNILVLEEHIYDKIQLPSMISKHGQVTGITKELMTTVQ